MLKRKLVALLLLFGLTVVVTAQTTPPLLDKVASRIRAQVEDFGVGHKITVKLKNGDHYHGTISKTDPDSFEIAEVDLAQVVKFRYAEIKSIYGDYGTKNVFGNRPNPKTSMITTLAVIGGLFTFLAILIPRSLD
jgi:hypothetical protein